MKARAGTVDQGARDPERLTSREREILGLVAQGASNKEIGRDLNLAESTVKIHVRHILRKLNLASRVQAAVYAVDRLPSGAIRALGGWASDKWGGNTVTWWVMWISLACMFLLSYPQTTMIVHGIRGDMEFSTGNGIVLFTVLIFIVGLAQGFGKASVYHSLADHYPKNMGVVGGLVGVIGGLGGFTLPIIFGIAAGRA